MRSYRYRFAGLLFDSELDIPEWEAFGVQPERAPDVRIVLDPAPAGSGTSREIVRSQEYRFAVPRVGAYRVIAGRRIVISRAPDATDGEVRLFLLGSALAAVYVQRGLLLLHAAVVRAAGRTIALCGPAGSGKSSLAAVLIRRGAEFVCDDVGRVDTEGGTARVHPSTPRMKLSPEVVEALGWSTERLHRVHPRAVKYHVPATQHDARSPVPLHAIYLLDWAEGPIRVTPLTGVQALRSLVESATYRPSLVEPMGQLGGHWERCAALAAAVRVSRLSRPRGWRNLDSVVAALGDPGVA